MAAFQLDALLTLANCGFAEVPSDQYLRVRYESLLNGSEHFERVVTHCELQSEFKELRAKARSTFDPAHRPRHWLDLTRQEKMTIEPVIEKWRTELGYR